MISRWTRLWIAALPLLAAGACSSGDSSGGGGAGSGGAGGSDGGHRSLDCPLFCQALIQPQCPMGPSFDECGKLCTLLLTLTDCPSVQPMIDCGGAAPRFHCDPAKGEPLLTGCETEQQAVSACVDAADAGKD